MFSTPFRSKSLALIILCTAPLLLNSTESREANVRKTFAGVRFNTRNVIFMIADGAGFEHFRASGISADARESGTVLDQFDERLAVATSPATGSGPTDSAAAGTAMSSGYKVTNGAIAMQEDIKLRHLIEDAESLNRSTGVVTSVQFSHATPAAFVAHTASRHSYAEIARQMVYESRCEVIMGCGHPAFDDNGVRRSTPGSTDFVGGPEVWQDLKDGRSSGAADCDGDGEGDEWEFIDTVDQFALLARTGQPPKRVLGVPRAHSTLQYRRSRTGGVRTPRNQQVPTLERMTQGALNVLGRNRSGFFLLVEGGAVDWASHDNDSGRMQEEMDAFIKAVEAVAAWVETSSSWEETLVIVTADHETGGLRVVQAGGRLQLQWGTREHTAALVPFFARGAGSRVFSHFYRAFDAEHGPWIDNTDIARAVRLLLRQTPPGTPPPAAGKAE